MTTNTEPYDLQLKLLLIGGSAVGMTSLMLRYINDIFNPSPNATIGLDLGIKRLVMDGCRLKLQIWDTAGQERFAALTRAYFRCAHGILLVYDTTSRGSFDVVRQWMVEIKDRADLHVDMILIGNKCDLKEKRAVTEQEGRKLAKEFGAQILECSARANTNVDLAFETLAKTVKDRLVANSDFPSVDSGAVSNLANTFIPPEELILPDEFREEPALTNSGPAGWEWR